MFSILGKISDQETDEKKFEDKLMKTIRDGNFEEIDNIVTPRAFQKCESKSLQVGMKVHVLV